MVGIPVGPRAQTLLTTAGELISRAEFTGPTPGLDYPQERLARSREAVRATGGTLAEDLHKAPEGSLADLMAQTTANIFSAAQTPERMFVQSLDNPDEIVAAQFNPNKLKETLGVDWQKFSIPGLSHQRLQYGSANNLEYRFELIFNAAGGTALRSAGGAYDGQAAAQIEKNLAARRQLHAWTLRRRDESLGAIGDTQRLLFVWPNFITLTCVPVSLAFEYTAFNREGTPTEFKVDVFVEEIRDTVMYAEDVLLAGTQRGSGNLEMV